MSTNLAVIDTEGKVIKDIYLRTQGRPIEVVDQGLEEIKVELGEVLDIRGVGTTGSGRELIGELVGADTVNDEITAHKTGAAFIDKTILGLGVDTIFEIGGQDAKFISLEEGIVVDFAMNEACAAGTGSFLEERAKELGIRIENDFASIALSSEEPLRLGERCTVFMERDVNSYLQRGASLDKIVAGLAYSVATNYINRVVRGRKIGEVIFFQGGTAYNDAVAAAFSSILRKRIIVPPFNGVMGALGVALLALEKMTNQNQPSEFRGFDLDKVNYSILEFTCKGCTNFCQMQRFTVEGEQTYWGDKCSERYRKAVKCEREPVIENLVEYRRGLLLADYDPEFGDGPVVGIPLSMSTYEWAPFWLNVMRALKIRVLLSEQTNNDIIKLGLESVVSEPCFPIQVAYGHIRWLIEKKADFILVPNYIAAPGAMDEKPSFFCPWNQTLPFVARVAPYISDYKLRIVSPTLWFNHGVRAIARAIRDAFRQAGAACTISSRPSNADWPPQKRFNRICCAPAPKPWPPFPSAANTGLSSWAGPTTFTTKESTSTSRPKCASTMGRTFWVSIFSTSRTSIPPDFTKTCFGVTAVRSCRRLHLSKTNLSCISFTSPISNAGRTRTSSTSSRKSRDGLSLPCSSTGTTAMPGCSRVARRIWTAKEFYADGVRPSRRCLRAQAIHKRKKTVGAADELQRRRRVCRGVPQRGL